MNFNKPFSLVPAYKDYLWGGDRLKKDFNKDSGIYPLAESWEASIHPDGLSYVGDGEFVGKSFKEVLDSHKEYLGSRNNTFPILVKFIDAKKDLSVQVHPNDDYARIHENDNGKTEMWYVLDALDDTKLIYGLKHECTKDDIRNGINDGTITSLLNYHEVKKDDAFFIPAGTIHAILAGSLIVEVQESSNVTYRLYDYQRVDKNGKTRRLDVEKGLDVANLKGNDNLIRPMSILRYKKGEVRQLLSRCKYFEMEKLMIDSDGLLYKSDELSFRILLCIDGHCLMKFDDEIIEIMAGKCVFVPANSIDIILSGKAKFLDIRC